MTRTRRFLQAVALLLGLLLAGSTQAQDTLRQYLSGRDKDNTVPWRFFCTAGAQSGYWTHIPVPSNWEMHGFGTLNYSRDATNPPPESGRYQLDFIVPANWTDRRVFLVFDAAMTDTEAKINGQSAGPAHQGGFYRFKYEITGKLKFNETNLLEVSVNKLSANAGVNRAERQSDYWLFGGIFRPVWLDAVPLQFIERMAIDARADGSFAVDVFVNTPSSPTSHSNADTLEAQIFELDGKPVGEAFGVPASAGPARLKSELRTGIASPRPWTAETPNLYRVEVRLKRGGQIVHRLDQRFGFRTTEVRPGDGIYVNGRRVVLKGVNRHSFWPNSGRCLSDDVHRLDIEAIKDMNMNAVRMSHYPPDERFLDLCDELGLYVLDELGGWQKSYDTEVGRKLVEEMIKRDVNHPSILFWDNGNEGGWNRELDDDFAQWDPQQRQVLHPWENFRGMNTDHYEHYESTKRLTAGSDIFMSTEFLHGLYDGGIGAGFEDYWELMRQSKVNGGGFFWALADEGMKRADTGKIDVADNRGPDGIVGPYREREGSFYTVKELWSPIVIAGRTLPSEPADTLTVENHYSFINASQCTYTWQLRKFNPPGAMKSAANPVEIKAAPPDIPPGQIGALKLNLPAGWRNSDALALRVNDPTGRELCTWVWPLNHLDHYRSLPTQPASQTATATETGDMIEVTAGDLAVRFDKNRGVLLGVTRGTQAFSLSNGPTVVPGEAKLAGLEMKQDGSDTVINAGYTGDLKSVTWRVRGNRWLQCDYTYSASGPKEYHGVTFDYPEALVKKKRWLGDGPYRVWKNRLRGVTLGVWENDYNNTITGWSEWKYPEFKGCFSNVRWMQLETAEGPITVIVGRGDSFVQVLKPELPPANLQAKTAVTLPAAGLAFLDAIPPMGNKFHSAAQTGPQSQPNMASGEYRGSISFYFGKLP